MKSLLSLRILKDLAVSGPSIAYPLQQKYCSAGCGNASVYNSLKSLHNEGYICKVLDNLGRNKYYLSPSGHSLLQEFQIPQPTFKSDYFVEVKARAS